MILKDNRTELNLNLKLRVDDFDYTVFVSTDGMKCFGCGKTGHLVCVCPDKMAQMHKMPHVKMVCASQG